MKFFIQYLLPGLGLMVLGFIAGAQPNLFFALTGFLAFFVAAVTLVIVGWHKHRKG